MVLQKLLVANRGEIAIRIMRAAADLGILSVAVHPADDAASLHTRVADEVYALQGRGAAAYLDIDQLVGVALQHGCALSQSRRLRRQGQAQKPGCIRRATCLPPPVHDTP